MVEDPEATNVEQAASTALQDAMLLCNVEQAESLLKNVKSARGNFARRKAISELQSATEKLQRNSGNDSDVERQRGAVLNKLGEISNEYEVQGESEVILDSTINGNGFLFEQDLGQNRDNYKNSAQFFDYNGRSMSPSDDQQAQPEAGFRFGISIQNLEKQEEFRAPKEEADQKSGSDKSGGEKFQRSRQTPRPESKSKADMKDGDAQERNSSRSQLMQRRAGQEQAGKPTDSLFGMNSGDGIQLQQEAIPQQAGEMLSLQVQQAATVDERAATPTGLLSLKFDIPTDGQQINFLRVGGNPHLTLDVRSSDSVAKGTGFLWLIVCITGSLLLIGPGRKGQALIFCQRLFLILAIAGLAAWLLTTGDLKGFGLLLCIAGSVAFATTTVLARWLP